MSGAGDMDVIASLMAGLNVRPNDILIVMSKTRPFLFRHPLNRVGVYFDRDRLLQQFHG
jgi:hypothetical protein